MSAPELYWNSSLKSHKWPCNCPNSFHLLVIELLCASKDTEPAHFLWPSLGTKPHGGHLDKRQLYQAESEVFLDSKFVSIAWPLQGQGLITPGTLVSQVFSALWMYGVFLCLSRSTQPNPATPGPTSYHFQFKHLTVDPLCWILPPPSWERKINWPSLTQVSTLNL